MVGPADLAHLDFAVQPKYELYLGLVDSLDAARWALQQDSIAVLGPPRYGKTSGVLIPQLYFWDGPAVVVSTRGDLLDATGNHRKRLAKAHGGKVYIFDPFNSEPNITSMRWSPLDGCTDPELTYRRVAEMTAAAGQGMSDGEHWRAGGARIMRGLMHAAAIDGRPLVEVADWIARHDVSEAIEILRNRDTPARRWAGSLEGLARLGDKERGSFFSVATRCLEVVESPAVERATMHSELDVDAFLDSKSTLYVVSPSHYQEALAPLLVGLVTAVTQRAVERAQAAPGGRLEVPLLVSVDEVSNTAPLPGLSGLVSEGGGRGITTVWASQSLDRMRERYGADETMAILGASTAKVVFGGLANDDDLRMFSSWEGEERIVQTTMYSGGAEVYDRMRPGGLGVAEPQDTQRQSSHSWIWRPVLAPDELRQTREGQAWLWYRSDPAIKVWTPPAAFLPPLARLSGYTRTGATR